MFGIPEKLNLGRDICFALLALCILASQDSGKVSKVQLPEDMDTQLVAVGDTHNLIISLCEENEKKLHSFFLCLAAVSFCCVCRSVNY